MVHIEQMLWPPAEFAIPVKINNLNETELWVFKDRLYNNLCTVINPPTPAGPGLFYTVFEDNGKTRYGVKTSGNPTSEWCYIREVKKL